jgi:hypothetical protein
MVTTKQVQQKLHKGWQNGSNSSKHEVLSSNPSTTKKQKKKEKRKEKKKKLHKRKEKGIKTY